MIGPLNRFITILICIYTSLASANEKLSPSQTKAIHTLVQAIEATHLYQNRHRIACLHFFPETDGKKYIIIAVHEKHSETCGGDEQTWPIVDRFKIARPYSNMKNIEWLNPANEKNLIFQTYAKKSIKNDHAAHSD
jgi:hypothetical protein